VPGKLGVLLALDAGADCFTAKPVKRLRGNSRRLGVYEGELGILVAAVEDQGGKGAADHVGGADAVAGVAGGGEGAAAAQGEDEG
jgi:hypothetical protein